MRVKFVAASAGAAAVVTLGVLAPHSSASMGSGPSPMNVGGTTTVTPPGTAMPDKAVPLVKAPHK